MTLNDYLCEALIDIATTDYSDATYEQQSQDQRRMQEEFKRECRENDERHAAWERRTHALAWNTKRKLF